MTKRLHASRGYPHDVADFADALADPGFHRARLDAGGGGDVERHEVSGSRIFVVVRQPVPAGQIPPAIARLLTGGLELRRTERWQVSDERCTGTVEVAVPLAPVRAEGTMAVEPRPVGCRLDVDVDVTVTIPFAGALLESAVVDGVRQLTSVEHDNITRWLDDQPAREA